MHLIMVQLLGDEITPSAPDPHLALTPQLKSGLTTASAEASSDACIKAVVLTKHDTNTRQKYLQPHNCGGPHTH